MIFFQYYPSRIDAKAPLGIVSLHEFLKANCNPSDATKAIFEQIAAAEAAGDMKTKAKLKQENLYCFTPCVYTDGLGRGYANIVSFNGLAVLDFDHIDNAPSFKYYMFDLYKCIIAGWLSPSKKGCKFLVKIPIVRSTDEFKSYFYGLAVEMEKYKGFDGTGQNCVLPLFLSYDPDLLYRDDAIVWEKRGLQVGAFPTNIELPKVTVEANDKDERRVKLIIKTAVDNIVSDGHPQIRSAALALGGYIATGYLPYAEGEVFINSLIASNRYLQKGVAGYQKTAKSAMNLGMNQPITLTE